MLRGLDLNFLWLGEGEEELIFLCLFYLYKQKFLFYLLESLLVSEGVSRIFFITCIFLKIKMQKIK